MSWGRSLSQGSWQRRVVAGAYYSTSWPYNAKRITNCKGSWNGRRSLPRRGIRNPYDRRWWINKDYKWGSINNRKA
jgi:hypothetical protein